MKGKNIFINGVLKTILLVFLAGMFFSSCHSDDPILTRENAIKKLYKKGRAKIVLANSFDENQTSMWEGALLAQKKIREKGLCPVDLELIKCDDGGTTISGTQAAYEIASDDEVCAVIGHGYSDISLPCSLIYQYYGILMFNYISTVHVLTERNNPLLFSNMPDDNDFGDAIARICDINGYKSVLIYYLENTSGTSLSNSFEFECNKRGISVVARDSYDLTTSRQDYDRIVKRWKNNFVFDAVFLAGRMPVIHTVWETMRRNGINCPLVGADPFDDPLFVAQLPESENEKIFAVSNFNTDSMHGGFREFFESFKEEYGVEPDQEALQTYDALMVLASAISKADSAVPSRIADFLRTRYWDEAAGPYTFNSKGAVVGRTLTAKVFRNGRFEEFPLSK